MVWTVILIEEVEDWYMALVEDDPETAVQVAAALDLLEREGPTLGRPASDRIKGSKLHHMKELRPGSSGRTEARMLYVFDPARQAVILVAGDKSVDWKKWYLDNVPVAEERYKKWLDGGYKEEHDG